MKESEIKELLKQTVAILERHRVQMWAKEFAEIEKQFSESQLSGDDYQKFQVLKRIRENYGGMGSFIDVFINPYAGDLISAEEVSHVNAELSRLSTELYKLVEEEISRFARNKNDFHN